MVSAEVVTVLEGLVRGVSLRHSLGLSSSTVSQITAPR